MKKFLVGLLVCVMVLGLVGCGSKENNGGSTQPAVDDSTMGGKLANSFLNEISKSTDIEAIANTLANSIDISCVVMPTEEGYMNGFTQEVSGFESAVRFEPMIGSIPFVAYIFEVSDAEGFKEKLLAMSDPRWNICTEAAETVCVTSGNYVFFTMCPGEDE